MKKFALLIALCISIFAVSYAQEPSNVELKVKEIVKRYKSVKGVDSMTAVKGRGLEMIKLMFNKQFGKDFMSGVKSITIINYTDASPEVCQALHQEVDTLASSLEELKSDNSNGDSEYSYARTFASSSENNKISDFIIALESNESKIIMYMAGDIGLKKQ